MVTAQRRTPAFAGIGSRKTPPDMLAILRRASAWLVADGWTCRTGGAAGADLACQHGAMDAINDWVHGGAEPPFSGALEVFLPWTSFGLGSAWYRDAQRHPEADLTDVIRCWPTPTPEAIALASAFHPAWSSLPQGAQKLHARNSHQILGRVLDCHPSAFVLCWTEDGADGTPAFPITAKTGGTGQALRIAKARGIPVRNIGNPATLTALLAKLPPSPE